MSRGLFAAWLGLTAAALLVQSAAHLTATLALDDLDSVVDLDRSNGLPDLMSTAVIALGCAGAVALALRRAGARRAAAGALAAAIAVVAVEDALHTSVGRATASGELVLASAVLAVLLIAVVAAGERPRVRWTLGLGVVVLVAALVVGDLDRPIPWLERVRGESIAELLIVAKQGLELAGWSLVALALWDAAADPGRRVRAGTGARRAPRPTASRRRVASTRRGA